MRLSISIRSVMFRAPLMPSSNSVSWVRIWPEAEIIKDGERCGKTKDDTWLVYQSWFSYFCLFEVPVNGLWLLMDYDIFWNDGWFWGPVLWGFSMFQFQTSKTFKEIQAPPANWRMLRQEILQTEPATHQQIHSITLLIETGMSGGMSLGGRSPFLSREKAEKREQTLRQAWNERIDPFFLNLSAHLGMRLKRHCFFAHQIQSGHANT